MRTSWCLVGIALSATACARQDDRVFDPSNTAVTAAPGTDEELIERREVCVGSAVMSAGKLGDTLYYQATTMPDGKLVVGYYAFWSEERPWGNNWMTWSVVPALAIDLVYSHGLFVGPGYQRFAYGRGDVEGFRIEYARETDGSLRVSHAVANDALHQTVQLSAEDVMSLDPTRPTLYSKVWSHQLGGRGVRSRSDLRSVRCYGAGRIEPLPQRLVEEYTLAKRAKPAHVEALGGHLLSPTRTAKR